LRKKLWTKLPDFGRRGRLRKSLRYEEAPASVWRSRRARADAVARDRKMNA
jgi:hypothetical protein